jgi:hypothetical protein
MSLRVVESAVAVSVIIEELGNCLVKDVIFEYSGRKSCHHNETQ